MRQSLIVLLAVVWTGCAPDLTASFVGEWSVTSGTYRDVCPPPDPSLTSMHQPGDATLSITGIDHETMAITLAFHHPMYPTAPSCDLTAIASNSSTASLQAKACSLAGTRHDVLAGTLRITENRALMLDYQATIGAMDPCQRADSSLFVPK